MKTTNIRPKDPQNKMHWTYKGCQILLKALIMNKLFTLCLFLMQLLQLGLLLCLSHLQITLE